MASRISPAARCNGTVLRRVGRAQRVPPPITQTVGLAAPGPPYEEPGGDPWDRAAPSPGRGTADLSLGGESWGEGRLGRGSVANRTHPPGQLLDLELKPHQVAEGALEHRIHLADEVAVGLDGAEGLVVDAE